MQSAAVKYSCARLFQCGGTQAQVSQFLITTIQKIASKMDASRQYTRITSQNQHPLFFLRSLRTLGKDKRGLKVDPENVAFASLKDLLLMYRKWIYSFNGGKGSAINDKAGKAVHPTVCSHRDRVYSPRQFYLKIDNPRPSGWPRITRVVRENEIPMRPNCLLSNRAPPR